MAGSVITLYDIPSSLNEGKPFSPNTWKTRYALNFKGIPYETVWVEMSDIEAVCKKIGAAPTSTWPDGSDQYTLPTIFDPRTGKVVSDSYPIALYLDETYPEKPALFPSNSKALQTLFQNDFAQKVTSKIFPLVLYPIFLALNPVSQTYFRQRREPLLGKLEAFDVPDEKRQEFWSALKGALSELSGLLESNGKGKLFVMGDTPSYADLTIAANLIWVKLLVKPAEWDAVTTWDEGRWGRFMAEFAQKYETIV